MKIVFSALKIDLVAAVEIEILPSTIDFAVAVVGHRRMGAKVHIARRQIIFHESPLLFGHSVFGRLPSSLLLIFWAFLKMVDLVGARTQFFWWHPTESSRLRKP